MVEGENGRGGGHPVRIAKPPRPKAAAVNVILDQKTTDRSRSDLPIDLAGPDGVPFGTLTPLAPPGAHRPGHDPVWSAAEVAEMKRRMANPGPTRPSEEVYREVFGENWRTRDHNAERLTRETRGA